MYARRSGPPQRTAPRARSFQQSGAGPGGGGAGAGMRAAAAAQRGVRAKARGADCQQEPVPPNMEGLDLDPAFVEQVGRQLAHGASSELLQGPCRAAPTARTQCSQQAAHACRTASRRR